MTPDTRTPEERAAGQAMREASLTMTTAVLDDVPLEPRGIANVFGMMPPDAVVARLPHRDGDICVTAREAERAIKVTLERAEQAERERDAAERARDLLAAPQFVGMGVDRRTGETYSLTGCAPQVRAMIVEALADILDEKEAPNYVEMDARRADGAEYIVRVQRAERPTPHELRVAAERERDTARAEAQRVSAFARAVLKQLGDLGVSVCCPIPQSIAEPDSTEPTP